MEKPEKQEMLSGLWYHHKSGKLYWVDKTDAVECTNGREDKVYVVYRRYPKGKLCEDKVFVREKEEFLQKFSKEYH